MHAMGLMEEIASDQVMEEAYRWLCHRRERYSPNNDVWTLRWLWHEIKPQLQTQLLAGNYRFDSLHLIPDSPDHVALWSSRDSLVQKAMAIVLTRHLAPLLPRECYHLIDSGGSKGALRQVISHLPGNAFVFRTDVKNYYAAIDHDILFGQLKEHLAACPEHVEADTRVLDLLRQYMRRMIYDAGLYTHVTRGIPMGCPLSPLMAAIYLKPLDDRMAQTGLFYVRFMDDWVVLSPSRWKLRAAVRTVNQTMAQLKMEQHPDKTFVGRISRGFDFLGYRISPAGLIGLARQSVQQTSERINQLYEQGADDVRIGQYVRRWWAWVRGGMLRACPGGTCLDDPQQLMTGILPVTPKDALRRSVALNPLGDLSPPAARAEATQREDRQPDQAGRFRNVRAGPGVVHQARTARSE